MLGELLQQRSPAAMTHVGPAVLLALGSQARKGRQEKEGRAARGSLSCRPNSHTNWGNG